jgi:ATP-binding cassette subfamily B protein
MISPLRKLSSQLERVLPQAAFLPRIARVIWESTRGWSLGWAVIVVIAGILPAAGIAITKTLVDAVANAVRSEPSWETMRPALIAGVAMACIAVLGEALQGVIEWIRVVQSELIQEHLAAQIHKKSVEVDFGFYESPDYYDRLYRARDDANVRVLGFLEHLGSVCQNAVTLVALTCIVISYSGFLFLAMLFTMLPAFFVVTRYNLLAHRWWSETTVDRRWIQYYDQKFTTAAAAAEMRLFRLGPKFHAAYQVLRKRLRESRLTLIRRQNVARLGAALLGVAVSGAAIGWMAWRTLLGRGTLGDLALFYQAFLGGQGFIRVITLSLGQVYSNSLYLVSLFEFLDLRSTITSPPAPLTLATPLSHGIRFENVIFRYPGSERVALDGLNLFVPAGKVVAVVGPNGAGKSTLIKLLSRFYDPEAGMITLDGVPLSRVAVEDLRATLSILFQLPVSYDATAADNIAMGDVGSTHSPARIREVAGLAGADEVISRLPRGYDTLLGKSFENGTELSAGEWQRIAMARAFLRPASIILLDEPTSFMDSWAEVEWFEKLRQLASGRTALIITHRFSIAMRADLIHVMESGKTVESGTHEDLIIRGGVYARSWRDQTRNGLATDVGERLGAVAV